MVDIGASGCDLSYAGGTYCSYNVQTKSGTTVYSEMAHLWYETLGNKAYCPPGDADCRPAPQAGWGLTNTGDFLNLHSLAYWSGPVYAPVPSDAWFFGSDMGGQANALQGSGMYALAVRPGDVAAAVPDAVVRRQRPQAEASVL